MEMAEPSYGAFSRALIPDCKPLLGVRLPRLRAMAKELVKKSPSNWEELLLEEDVYFEEAMLRGMLSGYGCTKEKNLEKALRMLDEWIPHVDNWSVCDSGCVSFALFEQHREQTWAHIRQYLYSDKEFEVRVGLILLLNHFLKTDADGGKMPRRKSLTMQELGLEKGTGDKADRENKEVPGAYIKRILEVLDRPFGQGYYARMAAAWLTAECFVTFPRHTLAFLQNSRLDDETFHKALQKICESKIPDTEVKAFIKTLKRKNVGNP